ncbi:MAG: hypothetical protein OEZ23_03180 [Gammaproteobacteria bacterium]|nr:hypothetical protein [Gammaproteobacteria bacterium]
MKYSAITALPLFMLLVVCGLASPAYGGDKNPYFKRPHLFGLFIGETRVPVAGAADETADTVGLEYEFRASKTWGAGLSVERTDDAFGGQGSGLWAVSLFYHPTPNWRFGVGRGKEKVYSSPSHTEPLTRFSIAYDFHFGGMGIAPTYAMDRINGEKVRVIGLTLTKPF